MSGGGENTDDQLAKMGGAPRLGHISAGSQLEGVEDILLLVFGAYDDDRQVQEPFFPHLFYHGDAVHFRHMQIQQHQVRLMPTECIQPRGSIRCFHHPILEVFQIASEAIPNRRFIFDGQN